MTVKYENYLKGVDDDNNTLTDKQALIVSYADGSTVALTYYSEEKDPDMVEVIVDQHQFRTLFDIETLLKLDALESAVTENDHNRFLKIATNETPKTALISLPVVLMLFKNLYSSEFIEVCDGTESDLGLKQLVIYGVLTEIEYNSFITNRGVYANK